MPGVVRLLAVFAHPDDESLAAGGLLASRAAAGEGTAVVTATWTRGTTRADELADALRILGAGEPRMLGYADARVPESAPGGRRLVDAPLDEVVRALVLQIRELGPSAVVTHDAHGGLTGHPDHVRTHRATLLAARECGVPQLHLATHPHSSLPVVRELAGARRALHTVPDGQVTAFDAGPWLDTKVAAVLAHRSEVERGALAGVVAGLSGDDRRRLLATEWYTRTSPVEGS